MTSLVATLQELVLAWLGGNSENVRAFTMAGDHQRQLDPAMVLDAAKSAYDKHEFDRATSLYKELLQNDPDNTAALSQIGKIHLETGRGADAIPFLERAFSSSREVEHARALGEAYLRVGRLREAADSSRYILQKDAGDEDALNRLATCALYAGQRTVAADLYAQLIERAPETAAYKAKFIASLVGVPKGLEPSLQIAYTKCLEDSRISCSPAVDAWFWTINSSAQFKTTLSSICKADVDECGDILRDQSTVDALNHSFLRLGVEKLVYPSDFLEKSFEKIRAAVLNDRTLLAPIAPFVRAIATQLFLTDYAIFESREETAKIDDLLDQFDGKALTASDVPDLLILACYRSLHLVTRLLENTEMLSDDEQIGHLIKLMVSDRAKEDALKSDIPKLGQIDNEVSKSARAQYEENPCPRWRYTQVVSQPDHLLRKTKGLKVLNAGCGTGLEATNSAQTLKTSAITALDLSLSSLAYGKRQSSELGVNNIDFVQGDILEVEKLDRTFDIVLSSGVLHHMADPQEGLNKLASVLKPKGGRMLIGLYSKIARENLFAPIWAHIEEKGYRANADDIRQFRKDVIESDPDHFLRNAQKFRDFTSLSECRDMLFHVQEHRQTWLDIEQMIEKAGLKLIKVLTGPDELREYSRMFPNDPAATDLKNWHNFELKHPLVFRNMYYFWLAHRDDRETADTSPSVWATNFL